MLNSKDILVFVSLSLSLCATVWGAPTVDYSGSDLIACSYVLSIPTHHIPHTHLIELIPAHDSYLASLAADVLYSPISSTAKSLPAVPGAMFMVLVGFLCVSFVRDRRFWLAMLFGLASLGQDVFTALPHWAWQVRSKRQMEHSATDATYASELEDSARLRSDIEGILDGLLSTTTLFLPRINVQDKLQKPRTTLCVIRNMQYARHITQYAILPSSEEKALNTDYIIQNTLYAISYTFYAVFNNQLARGPPICQS